MEYEIASKVLRTKRGSEVYVARNLQGELFRYCSGCNTHEFKSDMAPALAAIVEHAKSCRK
ncbi:hypothetical protein [Streptomyces sp. NPDC001404]|uniref:hypothetical protein n=1 Tax=Streptomyces sp. NPDC001404 TaxID=3364571 RepID=UPI0036B9C537